MTTAAESTGRSRAPFVLIGIALFIILATSFIWRFVIVVIGDGGFPIEITIQSRDGTIASVAWSAFHFKNQAESAIADSWLETPQQPFSGKPIAGFIKSSTRETTNGWVISRTYEKYLVVIAVLHDSRRIAKLAEIPDLADKIIVEVP